MKKKIATALIASFASFAAVAQGKIGFATDSLHLAYWTGGSLLGQTINSDNMFLGIAGIAANLYMGTSSSLLYLYSSASFGPLASGPGKWNFLAVQANANPTTGAPAIPGGSVFVEVAILSTERAAPNTFDQAAIQTFASHSTSSLITFTLGTSVTYPVLYGPNSGGTWAPGTWNLDQYGVGSRGAFGVPIPEPSTLFLSALGAGALSLFRRKSFQKGPVP